ncbi:MAG: flagellar hook-basal body complex protein FliE [Nitrospiraceae bacterium]|nr:flagellar hook-basal body complex protein FliE [Nitrospiraceae bacterium]
MPVDPMNVSKIGLRPSSVDPGQLRTAKPRAPQTDAPSFKDVLQEAVGEVQRLQNEADTTIRQLVAGEIKDVTQTMVAVEKADVAFRTMMTVRNKVVAAYEEIMRMQV